MEELGIIIVDHLPYWNGRAMTRESALDFLSSAQPHAARLREIIPAVGVFEKYHFTINMIDINPGAWVLRATGKLGMAKLSTQINFPDGTNHWYVCQAGNVTGQTANDPGQWLEYYGYVTAANYVADLETQARNYQKITAGLDARIAALEAENATLRADIEERRLRPGGEEYEAALERFTTQTYE